MSFGATAILGAVSGLTIFLGLPAARVGRPSPRKAAFLTAASVGILLFILYDVVRSASETVEGAMSQSAGTAIWYGALLAVGIAAGLFGLVVFEKLVRLARPTVAQGPGAVAVAPASNKRLSISQLSPPQRTAFFIALGIGLHNFSEGLAIGQSSAGGIFRLFYLLVIGFGLHNISEGFGITGPLIGQLPSWRFLAALGMIGGGPTFIGTLIGYAYSAPALSVLFLALAAGAIMYVIGELQHAGRKIGSHDASMLGLLLGFLLAYGTDMFLKGLGA